jgi:hypothetical protein
MFKFILIFILLIAFVPPLRRFLFWLVVGRQIVKEQKRYEAKRNPPPKKEGEINIEFAPKKESKGKFDGGQYVDYEEVKE